MPVIASKSSKLCQEFCTNRTATLVNTALISLLVIACRSSGSGVFIGGNLLTMDIRNFFTKKRQLDDEDSPTGNNPSCSAEAKSLQTLSKAQDENIQVTDLDLPKIGEPIKQIILREYPKQNNGRVFRACWFKLFKWLEYSVKKDAVFCYACRQFQPFSNKDIIYTHVGFTNWKNAMDSKNGFPRHEKTEIHLKAMVMWKERSSRDSSGTAVSTLINSELLEKYRYYVKSIAEVIQFLAVNELALRGSYVMEEEKERGLFISLFNYTLKKDKVLEEAIKHIPKNVKYTSPEIQNEIIGILGELVRQSIVDDMKKSDVPWFTLLEDGTRDRNNRENVSIGIRFVKDGIVHESLLGIYVTDKMDAKTFTDMTLQILDKYEIERSRLLSQCYDGASVMSGKKGGVSALMQKEIQRCIPYIHCYNHRLHLIVVKIVSEINMINVFFDQCIMLHDFFQHGKVSAIYKGKTIVRLLEQRWSGHLAIINVILANYAEIIRTLDEIIQSKLFAGKDIAKSIGIKSVMLKTDFRFTLILMKKILGLLEPADAALQGRSTSLKDAIEIITCVKNKIQLLRSSEMFLNILNESQNLVPYPKDDVKSTAEKRKRQSTHSLNAFFVMETLPNTQEEMEDCNLQYKGLYFEAIDLTLLPLEERFSDNDDLLMAISSIEEFDLIKLQPLKKLGKRSF